MTADRTCQMPPFLSPVVAQVRTLEDAGSALEILTQVLEGYMAQFRSAICDDLTQIVDECCGATPPGDISFLDLTDTPDSYAGAAGLVVTVNMAETGLEFAASVVVESFLDLTDTPATYAGSSGLYVTVNGTEDALVFTALPVPLTPRPDISTRLVSLIKPLSGSALGTGSLSIVGSNSITVGGTSASSQAPTGASPLTGCYRYRIVSGALAGGAGSIRHNVACVTGGGLGWRFVIRWGSSTALAQQRFFGGLSATTGGLANANPSTFVDLVGVSYNSAATVLSVIHSNTAGAATTIGLGASFPVNNSSFYEAEFVMLPGSGEVTYRVLNLGTGAETTGTISSNLPSDTTVLGMQLWLNNGTTASATQLDMHCMYLETSQ